ncbi:MAG: CvpA family protein [Alphaproteobacteria bacterium]|uniref:CvpA family protein n=1 Tax=Brevundimonas sp. TaxID=1871086 RepID=UPI0017A58DEE|nr:CvpA family protein [Brevundimonas sp.]MBU3969947.1 CvpA family protein [Alphaproteobacteria bacterium]MBA3049107.1 CvpA family protein [Brevundimonas sp.]MBU3974922.1 CvpA family protein [Alphaproteobacteria bacterium]MBU4040472.1 CvpA family protein [Alphaproteobacteria bacterium]MBU4135288.1 CvpA family protein [Alphaproteobacteria bacterium]
MTGFDVIAILVILASAAAGWVRGATREIITLLSFVLAAFIALVALPLTAPLGRALVDPDWAGTIFAAVASFLLIYFGIRIFGSILSKRAQAHPQLGGVDRFLGVFVGAARSLVLLGAIHLVVVAAMPGERTPRWLSEAALRPVTAGAARMIQIVLPGIGRGADALTPVVTSSVSQGFSDEEALPSPQTDNTPPASAAD